MSIILDRKTEVTGDTASREFDDVLTGAEEFDDAEREIGKTERIGGVRCDQELLQDLCVGFLGQR